MQVIDRGGCVRLLCPIALYTGLDATIDGVKLFPNLSLVIPVILANPWLGIGGNDSDPLITCIALSNCRVITLRDRDLQMDIPVVVKSINACTLGLSGGVVRVKSPVPGAAEALAGIRRGAAPRQLAREPEAHVQ